MFSFNEMHGFYSESELLSSDTVCYWITAAKHSPFSSLRVGSVSVGFIFTIMLGSKENSHHFFSSIKITLILTIIIINLQIYRLGLATEFRSEKIPRNRLGMDSVIPRKKMLIPRAFRGSRKSLFRSAERYVIVLKEKKLV
jgi:hypothetical protein